MTVRQALVSVARVLSPMLQCARKTLAIALIMVAVAITGSGWSVASAIPSANGFAIVKGSSPDHHMADDHDQNSAKQARDLVSCEGLDCGGSHHQSQDMAQKCCAAACHTAILSVTSLAPVSFVTWPIKHHQLAGVLEEAGTIRLERPPRPIHA